MKVVKSLDIVNDYIEKLEQENKQLKQRYERLVQEHIDTITRNEEKQQRIDKATEYTERLTNGKTSRIDTWENVELVLETILQILKGE